MLSSYDHYKLDNGEARSRTVDYEPDKEVELPLTCQKCETEYSFDAPGATAGHCPRCNGHERRHLRGRRASDRKLQFAFIASFAMTFLTGIAIGYYYAASEAAAMVLGAR
jgi:hypothetical protein